MLDLNLVFSDQFSELKKSSKWDQFLRKLRKRLQMNSSLKKIGVSNILVGFEEQKVYKLY